MENQRLKIFVLLLLNIFCLSAFSQQYKPEWEFISDDAIRIKAVYNNDKEHFIKVYIDGANDNAFCGTIGANSSLAINKNCTRFVKVEIQGGGLITILDAKAKLQERKEAIQKNQPNIDEQPAIQEPTPSQQPSNDKASTIKNIVYRNSTSSVEASDVLNAFELYINNDEYYSNSYFNSLNSDVTKYVEVLKNAKDKEEYINEHQLKGYLTDTKVKLKEHQDNVEAFINDFLNSNYSNITINEKQRCLDEMHTTLFSKLKERKDAVTVLEEAIDGGSVTVMKDKILGDKSMLTNIGIAILLLIIFLVIIIKIRQNKAAKTPTVIPVDTAHQNAQADIVVRRKTTSILKKQSLEDVHNNPSYLKIDCSDFCDDSAVRRIYFKNTCIKDIYNMYAEDLRNPENPNEDGCMVLGRWVHDADADEYYVSLEEIVKPGDDAVFKEYELNFGGKIKLKVSEKLRKLRRETNLQYDMTCWVHSHPGLGVFFSNADSGVQMQLKHPTHPKFLTAIVIDILTPNQELGIFTFKHDMSINSKPELKKMYSLEEMYKWAVSSDRNSFKAEDFYNLMLTSKERTDSCYGVQLSNGAIIDMCQMEAEQQSGLVGWVQGFNCNKGARNEFVIKSVSKEEVVPDNDILGCFMIGTHRSLPTIRKAITNMDKIQFILFYSTSDEMLTAIPVINGQLSTEENYYGEEKLEELKIWTRRKR